MNNVIHRQLNQDLPFKSFCLWKVKFGVKITYKCNTYNAKLKTNVNAKERNRLIVQDLCCKSLSRLLHLSPSDILSIVGEDSDDQFPLYSACLAVMLIHSDDPGVFVSACDALYWLSADNAKIQVSWILTSEFYLYMPLFH